tara:strand:- start:145849 stop:146319 length:471 start_codon:yes stop_codon:yes gene_type:complete
MSSIFLLLQKVHDSVHDFPMKANYSEPKIFTGGVDISQWNKLSRKEQRTALSKSWYVYFSFRDPATGKLKRQNNIKKAVNDLKTKKDRIAVLKALQRNLLLLLEAGFNPYQDNIEVMKKFSKKSDSKNAAVTIPTGPSENTKTPVQTVVVEPKPPM